MDLEKEYLKNVGKHIRAQRLLKNCDRQVE
jgi:hypothetical protein